MQGEIARATQRYPEARYLGIADGASSNWPFLEQHTERQLIDFFHATEYVGKIAQAPIVAFVTEAHPRQWQPLRRLVPAEAPRALRYPPLSTGTSRCATVHRDNSEFRLAARPCTHSNILARIRARW